MERYIFFSFYKRNSVIRHISCGAFMLVRHKKSEIDATCPLFVHNRGMSLAGYKDQVKSFVSIMKTFRFCCLIRPIIKNPVVKIKLERAFWITFGVQTKRRNVKNGHVIGIDSFCYLHLVLVSFASIRPN